MKKADIMLKFLFYAILALIIFIPTVLWGTQFLKISNRAGSSYSKLIQSVSEIKDKETLSMPLHMNRNSMIIGISKNADKIESITYDPVSGTRIIDGNINRPAQCEKGKACICLCKSGVSAEGEQIKCDEEMTCNKYQQIDFLKTRFIKDLTSEKTGNDKSYGLWNNGFIIVNSRDRNVLLKAYSFAPREYFIGKTTNIDTNSQKLRTIYIQRYQDFVNVCFNRECITDETIKKINEEEAIKEFNRFKNIYMECKAKNNAECGTVSLNMPSNYYIFYRPLVPGLSFGFLSMKLDFISDKEGTFFLFNTPDISNSYLSEHSEEIIVRNDKVEKISFEGTTYVGDNAEYQRGFSINFNVFDIKARGGKVLIEEFE